MASGPNCGRCKTALDTSGKPVTVTDANFDAVIRNATVPVLVDVWAPWCGPCRMVAPILDQIGAENAGRLIVAKLNSDENPAIAQRLKIRSIPALFVYKGGEQVKNAVGALPKPQVEALVRPYL